MKSKSALGAVGLSPARRKSKYHLTKSRITSLALAITTLIAFSGCATNGAVGKNKQALVCPQCKMVAETVERHYTDADESGRYGQLYTETVYKDSCPGCQGAIKTFFKEGKLQHKCSVCKDAPFTCPIFHPINP
ncbi:hypothetical protein BH09VER1_BH09VER1_12110 [soil metagenome]